MGSKINKKGLLGTIIFHGIIAAILLLLGFHTPLPLPEEKGILISFGDKSQGNGTPATPQKTKKLKPQIKKTVYQKIVKKPKTNIKQKSKPRPKILTQKHEDAPSLNGGNAKKNIDDLEKKDFLKKKREKEILKKKREAEKRRIENEKRIRLEQERITKEKEAQRKIEEEKKRKEEERKKKFAESMNSRAKNLFGKSNNKSTGNGNTEKPGNQGSQSGSPKGNLSGTGTGNKGIAYDLKGRIAEYLHKPQINFSKGGKVVVEVIVDNAGKVVRATPGAFGTTTSNKTLYGIAKKSAFKTRFNISKSAPKHQKGTITYIFIVK